MCPGGRAAFLAGGASRHVRSSGRAGTQKPPSSRQQVLLAHLTPLTKILCALRYFPLHPAAELCQERRD